MGRPSTSTAGGARAEERRGENASLNNPPPGWCDLACGGAEDRSRTSFGSGCASPDAPMILLPPLLASSDIERAPRFGFRGNEGFADPEAQSSH